MYFIIKVSLFIIVLSFYEKMIIFLYLNIHLQEIVNKVPN